MDHKLPAEITEIMERYNIIIQESQIPQMKQYGLDNILFMIILQKQEKLGVLNFNLLYFDRKYCDYFDNPLNALEFRIKLLLYFKVQVRFFYAPISKLNGDISNLIKEIKDYKCILPSPIPDFDPVQGKYIIFHTKLRLGLETKHRIPLVRRYVCDVLSDFKCKYKIVLLGERDFLTKRKIAQACIATIYPELQCLKKNNEVLDLTEDSIHDNLDYDSLKKSIFFVRGAEGNVTFGWGGSFCLALIFGKECITYIDQVDYSKVLNSNNLRNNNNTYLHKNIGEFKENIFGNYGLEI